MFALSGQGDSITDLDWPDVRARLLERIELFGKSDRR